MAHVVHIQPVRSEEEGNSTKAYYWSVKLASALVRALVILFALTFAPDASAQGLDGCPDGHEGGPGNVCVKQCPRPMQRIDGTDLCERGSYERRGYEEVFPHYAGAYKGITAMENCLSDDFRPYGIKVNEAPSCFMQGRLAYRYCLRDHRAAPDMVCIQNCPAGFTDINGQCKSPAFQVKPSDPGPKPEAAGWKPSTTEEMECTSRVSGWRLQIGGQGRVPSAEETMVLCSGTPNGRLTFTCVTEEAKNPRSSAQLISLCRPGGTSPFLRPQVNPQPPTPDPPVQSGPDPNARDQDGNSDLHFAILYNKPADVNKLLNLGFDANARNNSGETPVTLAAEFAQAQNMMALLARGGDLNAAVDRVIRKRNENLFRTIIGTYQIRMTNQMFDQAISSGAVGIAILSLNYGVDPNHAMAYAVRVKNVQMVDSALQKGGNPDLALRFGMENRNQPQALAIARRAVSQYNASAELAMQLAIPMNDSQTLIMALDRGANPSIGLPLAVKAGNIGFVHALLARNADPNTGIGFAVSSEAQTAPQMVDAILAKGGLERNVLFSAISSTIISKKTAILRRLLTANPDVRDKSILGIAGASGDLEIIDLILSHGGSEPGYIEVMLSGTIHIRNYELTKYLIDKGADASGSDFVEVAVASGDRRIVELILDRGGKPAAGMATAVDKGHAEIVELLVSRGARATDPKLIASAAAKGNASIVETLLKAGAVAENGMKQAVSAGHGPIVSMLIEKGADATNPPLIMNAVKSGNARVAAVLLNAGAPKNGMDELGQPLVMIAALQLKIDVVKVLLLSGVDPNAKNRAGDTALHIIANDEASKGYPKFKKMKKARLPMVQALVDGGADVNATNAKGETVRKSLGGGDGDVKKILDAAGAVNKLPTN